MMLFTKSFWSMAFERMVKTIAQTAIAVITASSFIPELGESWVHVAGTSALAGLISVLTSMSSYDAVSKSITADQADDVKLAVTVGNRQGPLKGGK